MLAFGRAQAITTTAQYFTIVTNGISTTESVTQGILGNELECRRIDCSAAASVGAVTTTFSLRDDGADAIACSITSGNSSGSSTTPGTIAAGSLINWKIVATGTSTNQFYNVFVECRYTT